ncbi:hypothetical protein NQ318_002449 [Aromia moschata]|uniref:Nuclear respiratory factor 1 NLS/DNA-binding dimerisation domain-containing protein n=1 Tax=Aromia moschata TaxID=1265417 RepID=A0AAV8Y970_9CUCU|nr:hypothetical protein NQ318_002449 [Aromia moschata]
MNSQNGNQNNTEQIAMVVGSPGAISAASEDDDDNCPSSPGSGYEEGSDLMAAAMGDEVTAQLAAAGRDTKPSTNLHEGGTTGDSPSGDARQTEHQLQGVRGEALEDVIKNLRGMIMEELENALAHQAPPPIQEDPTLFELPPLIIDGIPTPVEKMTQAQLRRLSL